MHSGSLANFFGTHRDFTKGGVSPVHYEFLGESVAHTLTHLTLEAVIWRAKDHAVQEVKVQVSFNR